MPNKTFVRTRARRGITRIVDTLAVAWLGLVVAVVSGCSGPSRATPDSAPPQSRPAKTRVGVVRPSRKDLVRRTTLPGTLVAISEATIYGKVAGYLSSISVDKGDTVRKGQTLAVLEAPEMARELDQADAAYQEAQAMLNRAKALADLQAATYRRYNEVHSKDPEALSAQELDEFRSKNELAQADVKVAEAKVATAGSNRQRLAALERYTRITAPFSGVVTARLVDPGALIQAATSSMQGQAILTLQDLNTVRVYVNVPEVDVPAIHAGTPASLRVSAYPQQVFKSSVTRFAEALDPATRTMKVEIDVPNPQHLVRPGMYADVALEMQRRPDALVLPNTALITEGDQKLVYVVSNGVAHRIAIETGLDDGTQIEIRSGLKGTEQVVVTGKEELTEGKAVEATTVSSSVK